jgi:GTPase SAR1 family protein
MKKNPELDLAYEFVQYTNRNIFLTGKAGTGKTTFLKSLKTRSQKRMVVVAPTGVAAINAGGQTIHSFFQLPFGPIITERVVGHKVDNPNFKQKFAKKKINIIKSLDLVVIDEISMVRADVLDAIDDVLRRYKNRALPFGGVQLLMIGDLQQLAPVVKDDEWAMMRQYYASMFFFNSKALKETEMVSLELKHVYRQSEGVFLDILNEIRDDKLSQESFDRLHQRYIPDFNPKKEDGYITLTTHNNSAHKINDLELAKLNSKSKKFKAIVKGNFSEYSYPTDMELELKVGAQVMFVKNDSNMEKRYFNGKIGVITSFDEDFIVVKCEGDEEDIYTEHELWENIKYSINEQTKEITEEIVGSFSQYPLRLAWAITIHKSQGLTFDKAIIDAAAAFAHGQTYVALSRCRTLEGLVLSSKISNQAIICDREVSSFNRQVEANQPDEQKLKLAKYTYQLELVKELFSFKQLAYWFERLEKILWENIKSYQGNLKDLVVDIQKVNIPELNKVSRNFALQIQTLVETQADVEQNKHLQERIKKASDYFYNYLEERIIKILQVGSFETDNKETKKVVQDALDHIYEILNIKQQSFKSCKEGFRVSNYLDVRAKASIDGGYSKKKIKTPFREVDTIHSELYSMLKFWRREEGEVRLIPLFQIATNKMLQGVANALPTTEKQLLKIKGVGKRTLEEYGFAIIDLVKEYMAEKGIEAEDDTPDEIKLLKEATKAKKRKPPKVRNHEKSYKLYLDGKEIPEIAELMGFVETTIEGHLAKYIISGDLDVDEFVDQEVIDKIMEYYKSNPEATMSEVRAAFDNNVSWSDIRFVKNHMEFLASQDKDI